MGLLAMKKEEEHQIENIKKEKEKVLAREKCKELLENEYIVRERREREEREQPFRCVYPRNHGKKNEGERRRRKYYKDRRNKRRRIENEESALWPVQFEKSEVKILKTSDESYSGPIKDHLVNYKGRHGVGWFS